MIVQGYERTVSQVAPGVKPSRNYVENFRFPRPRSFLQRATCDQQKFQHMVQPPTSHNARVSKVHNKFVRQGLDWRGNVLVCLPCEMISSTTDKTNSGKQCLRPTCNRSHMSPL